MDPDEPQPSRRPPGLGLQTAFLYAEFLALVLAGFAAVAFGRISPLPSPPLGHKAVVILLLIAAGLAAVAILADHGVRAHELGEVAGREDQVGVRQRAYAVGGLLVAVGGLGGLIAADVLTNSQRQVLVASVVGVVIALGGAYGRLISNRRALAREAVALLRRAARAESAAFDDRELARLEILLSATWAPGSRSSWMTARAAESFCEQLALPERRRDPAFDDCLKRVLFWVESGSGLVGASHADTGLTSGLVDLFFRLQKIRFSKDKHLTPEQLQPGTDDAA
jgi:hypothetical protein